MLGAAENAVQAALMEIWRNTTPDVLLAVALREFAGKVDKIQHLNITPDLIGAGLQELLRRRAEK